MLAAPLSAPAVDPLWPALAQIGANAAPAWRWRRSLGTSPDESRFLRRVAMLADRVPCPHACGCGKLHRVEQIEPGEFCAIPEEEDCESAPVSRDELAVFVLDVVRIATVIARAVSIRPEISAAGDTFGTHRLGIRRDNTSAVYLSFPSTEAETLRIAHALMVTPSGAFTLLVPTGAVLSHAVRTLLAAHGATCAALSDHIKSTDGDTWKDADPLPPLPEPASSIAPALSDRAGFARGNSWPHARPDRPGWSDVSLTMHLQQVYVRFGASQASFDYRDIDGFTDRRGSKRPNRVWTMLRAFASKQGVLPLPRKTIDPVRVRTLTDLERVFGRFFGIAEGALDRDLDQRTVRCRFRVSIKT